MRVGVVRLRGSKATNPHTPKTNTLMTIYGLGRVTFQPHTTHAPNTPFMVQTNPLWNRHTPYYTNALFVLETFYRTTPHYVLILVIPFSVMEYVYGFDSIFLTTHPSSYNLFINRDVCSLLFFNMVCISRDVIGLFVIKCNT